jgi:hypothetical protein
MKNVIFLIALTSLLHFGCEAQLKQQDKLQNGDDTSTSAIEEATAQTENQASDSLSHQYKEDAIKILENGKILDGTNQITSYFLSDTLKLVSIKSDTVITANTRRAIDYEISENTYSNGERHKALIIWQIQDGKRKRVFEFTSKIASEPYSSAELDDRRNLWISLCNQHDAKELIQELYSENTIYYNHKPLVIGRELLVGEYQYMNNTAYQLSLQPAFVERVNKSFAFEIGQCVGSYNGKYILIWKQDDDGIWRIFIDSNI